MLLFFLWIELLDKALGFVNLYGFGMLWLILRWVEGIFVPSVEFFDVNVD